MPEGQTDVTVKESDGVKLLIAKWAYQQSVPSVLLFVVVLIIYQGGKYIIDEAGPRQLKAITDGYEKIERSHRDERERRDAEYLRMFRELSESIRHNGRQ